MNKDFINLKTLKRIHGQAKRIVFTFHNSAVYEYSLSDDQWTKLNIEGSLFVVETENAFAVIVLNRLEVNNFVLELSGNKVEEKENVFMFDGTRIYGVWIESKDEQQMFREWLSERQNAILKTGVESGGSGDVLDLLHKAKDKKIVKNVVKRRIEGIDTISFMEFMQKLKELLTDEEVVEQMYKDYLNNK